MKATTARQKAIRDAMRRLVPDAPYADASRIFEDAIRRHLRHMAPHDAVILTATGVARHEHTEYDALLAEGQDRDAARFLVADDTDDVLERWGATFRVGRNG